MCLSQARNLYSGGGHCFSMFIIIRFTFFFYRLGRVSSFMNSCSSFTLVSFTTCFMFWVLSTIEDRVVTCRVRCLTFGGQLKPQRERETLRQHARTSYRGAAYGRVNGNLLICIVAILDFCQRSPYQRLINKEFEKNLNKFSLDTFCPHMDCF